MNQEPDRRKRSLPTFKRLAFEYIVMLAVTMVAFYVTGYLLVALLAALVAMIGLRMTRPKRTD